jgi:hypothetical protein
VAGLSWFYRVFIELGSSEFVLPVVKLVSTVDYVPKVRVCGRACVCMCRCVIGRA